MLATKIKNEDEILKYLEKKTIVFKCFGCKEVYFPEDEVNEFLKNNNQNIIEITKIDYLCNENFTETIVNKSAKKFEKCENIIVFSCGVGVQVISKILGEEKIYKSVSAGCDTFILNGSQGITAQKYSCYGCEECYLNWTGGICPFSTCLKGLLNGPCGGADKNGKCEVNRSRDCAWIKIYKKIKKLGIDENLKENDIFIKNYLLMGKKKESPL